MRRLVLFGPRVDKAPDGQLAKQERAAAVKLYPTSRRGVEISPRSPEPASESPASVSALRGTFHRGRDGGRA